MEEKTLLDHWLVLYKRRWLIVFVMLSSMITAGVVSEILPPVYEGKAVFFVPQTPDVVSYLASPTAKTMSRSPLVPMASEEPHAPYIGILKSRAIAELVQREFPHKTIENLYRKDTDFTLSNEYMIEVYTRDRDPVNAAAIANAYVKHLNEIVNKFSSLPVTKNELILEREIESTRAKLAHAKQKLKEFQEKNKTAALDEETRQLISQKMDFQSRYETTQVERRENETKIAALKPQLAKEAILFTGSELVITSPLLEDLRERLAEVDAKLVGSKPYIHEIHPDFISLKEQHAQIEKSITNEIKKIVDSKIKAPNTFYEKTRQQLVGLFVEKERIQSSLQAYRIVIAGIDSMIQKIPELAAQLDSLKMEVEKFKARLQTLENNLEEVKIQREKDLQSVVMVDEATPPSKPAFPVMWLNLLVSALFGLIAGIIYCFFVDYIERTRGVRIIGLLKAIEKSRKV